MKNLLLPFLLLAGLAANAQAWHNPLPVDSTTHLITYQGVVQVPGATQAELYSRAREWFAVTFGSAKEVLEMDDRGLGKLIGRAYAQFDFSSGFGPIVSLSMWRTIKIESKDGRYRYTLNDFALGGSLAQPQEPKPIEKWFEGFQRSGKPLGKMASKMVESTATGIQQTAGAEIASLKKALASKTGSDF